jgi:hypothetical protein
VLAWLVNHGSFGRKRKHQPERRGQLSQARAAYGAKRDITP